MIKKYNSLIRQEKFAGFATGRVVVDLHDDHFVIQTQGFCRCREY